MQGKTLMQRTVAVNSLLFTQNTGIATLAKGIYVARLTDAAGTTLYVARLVKE